MGKNRARTRVSWNAFERAMGCLGFSVARCSGSAVTFAPEAGAMEKRSITLHRPHNGQIEGYRSLILERRLGKVYGWKKNPLFEDDGETFIVRQYSCPSCRGREKLNYTPRPEVLFPVDDQIKWKRGKTAYHRYEAKKRNAGGPSRKRKQPRSTSSAQLLSRKQAISSSKSNTRAKRLRIIIDE